jgi:hypothetical protein
VESESGLESARLMDMLRQRLLTLRPLPFIGAHVLIMVLVGLGRVTTVHATTDVVTTAAAGDGNYFGLRPAFIGTVCARHLLGRSAPVEGILK